MNNVTIDINETLLNSIAPKALKFSADDLSVNEKIMQGLSCYRYPASVKYEWLTPICNINNTMTSLTWTPEPNVDIIIKDINSSVGKNKNIVDGITPANFSEQVRATQIVSDGLNTIDRIVNKNQQIGYVSLNLLCVGDSKNDLKAKSKTCKNKIVGKGMNCNVTTFLQKETYNAVAPFGIANEDITLRSNRLMPLSTVLGGFPFAFSGYNDGEGEYWGKDDTGGLIVIDNWKRGQDRNNSNLVIMGGTGIGKSTALKHLILNEWELGTKIFIIDPQGEYKSICNEVGGDWIDVAGGTGGMINPFEIFQKAIDEDEKKLSDLAKHINNLEVFFKLYSDLDNYQLAILKEAIELTYAEKNISWKTDISKLKSTDYPVMLDLYNLVCKKAEKEEATLKRNERNFYKEISILLRNIAIGSDSFLWNGHTTVNPQTDFVVFDTSNINGNTNNIKTTLYHTVLNYCENALYRDKNERAILLCDEAHNMIDKRLPETVKRLSFIEKTVRKFESAIWIASQQLIDFLDPSIAQEGRAMLDMPNIKLLMPVGRGKDLKELQDLYDLTEAEIEILQQQQRGSGILFVGSRHLFIKFDIPPHHLSLMGTGGGR
ncbi:MAG: ATP-binding protein [Oscillospiraceae bacterium]